MRHTETTLREYFESAGGIETLLAVDPAAGTLTETIKSNLLVSGNTASKRIQEAKALGLLEPRENDRRDHPIGTRYYLTEKGRICLVGIVSVGLDEKITLYHNLSKQIDNFKEVIAGWTERMSVSDIDQNNIEDESLEPYKEKDAYQGENLPDYFEEFITATLDYDRRRALERHELIDYDHLFDSEYRDSDQ
jgi:hypothetical protein